MAQEDKILKAIMKSLRLRPPEEDIITEWPTWPFTRLTPGQVQYFDMMQKRKKAAPEQPDDFEEAPF